MKFQNSIKSVKFLLDKEIQFSVHVKPFIFVLYPNKLELGRINRNTRTGNVKTSKTSEKCQKMPFLFQKIRKFKTKTNIIFSNMAIFMPKKAFFQKNDHFECVTDHFLMKISKFKIHEILDEPLNIGNFDSK